jgi:thiol-disulfide isomerase/thioredoxin
MLLVSRALILLSFVISGMLNSNTPPLEIISFETFEQMTKKPSDKIRIYNFWATWCAPCVKEMPAFEKVSSEDSRVELLFISLDDGRRPERVSTFIEKRGVQSPVYLLNDVDFNSWINKVSQKWSGAIPATLFVKPNGERLFHEGELDESELRELISQLN